MPASSRTCASAVSRQSLRSRATAAPTRPCCSTTPSATPSAWRWCGGSAASRPAEPRSARLLHPHLFELLLEALAGIEVVDPRRVPDEVVQRRELLERRRLEAADLEERD